MKKKYITIIVIVVLVILIGGAGFFIYKSTTQNKGIEKANELIKEREYSKALASFELVLDDDSNNQEALKGKEILEDYIDAEKDFNEGNLKEANKALENMPNSYSNYKELKEDVDSLKGKVNNGLKENEDIDKEISNIRDLINKNEYSQAKKAMDLLQNKKLNEDQKKTFNDLKGRIDSELKKSNNNSSTNKSNTSGKSDMALDRIKYLNKLKDIQNQIDSMAPGDTTVEINQNTDAAYKAWDGALNDIYGYLKDNLPNDKFKVLEKDEVRWIKEKEKNAKEAADKYKGGTAATSVYLGSLADQTKDRCYELVNEYMN